jgi:hypothetical protein
LKPLLPPAPPAVVDVSARLVVREPVVATRWYQRMGVQIGLLATVVAAVVGGYLWVQYQEPSRPWDQHIDTGSASKR